MQNTKRLEVYLRGRSELTPAQRRRVAKHDRRPAAAESRMRRRARERFAIRLRRAMHRSGVAS